MRLKQKEKKWYLIDLDEFVGEGPKGGLWVVWCSTYYTVKRALLVEVATFFLTSYFEELRSILEYRSDDVLRILIKP